MIRGIDLSDRIAIVTGGCSGIGLETTRAPFDPATVVIVPARNRAKAETALHGLGNVKVEAFGLRPRARDPVHAGRLWTVSEELTGVSVK